jgi:hypothetical protein
MHWTMQCYRGEISSKLQQRQQHRLSPEDLDFSAMRVVKAEARMPMLILL